MATTGGGDQATIASRARARLRTVPRKLSYRVTTSAAMRRAESVGHPDRREAQQRFQIDFLIAQGLRPEHRVLDIGCGPLRAGIPLIAYLDPRNYTGIEARKAAFNEARKAVAEARLKHKRPRLIRAEDPTRVRLQQPVDYGWAFMLLIHLNDEILDGYLRLLADRLENGVFYANARLGEFPEGNWQGFPFVSRPPEFYRAAAASHGLSIEEVGSLRSLGHCLGALGDETVMLRFTRSGVPAAMP
jgi:SAM-dependent methyltransferase